MQSLTCRDLFLRNGRREIVRSFTWRHAAGGIAWLVGSNGSGKSSLLRVFAGWQRASGGSIEWTGLTEGRVRYFNPNMHAAPELRVDHLIAFVEQAGPAVEEPAHLDELYPSSADEANRFGQLSTGESKRLLLWSFLRAGNGPFVLDEPYEHLSREAKAALTRQLQHLATSTLVIVATNQDVPPGAFDSLLSLDGTTVNIAVPDA